MPKFSLPSVVSQIPPDLRQFVERVREALNSDRLLLKDDVSSLQTGSDGKVVYVGGGTGGSGGGGAGGGGGGGGGSDGGGNGGGCTVVTPPRPTGLEATGSMSVISLSWDPVSYCGHAYTEVWASQTTQQVEAELIGSALGRTFSHAVGEQQVRYYWIRCVNTSGQAGPYHATLGVRGATTASPEYLLDTLRNRVTESMLFRTLNERINLIDGSASLPGSVNARIAAISLTGSVENRTYVSDAEPTGTETIPLVAGDLWFDSNDGNKLYRYSGTAWVLVRDTGIAQAISDAASALAAADGKIVSFYQPEPPTTADEGDIWFDTNDGNKIYVRESGAWVNRQDSKIAQALLDAADAQATADGKIVTFFQETTPTAAAIGDLWVDTANSNKLKRWNGTSWVEVSDTRVGQLVTDLGEETTERITADSALSYYAHTVYAGMYAGTGNSYITYVQETQPSGGTYKIGDMWAWYGTSDIFKRWNGSSWIDSTSNRRAAKYHGALASPPSSDLVIGDLYLDTDNNTVYVYTGVSGSLWVQRDIVAPELAALVSKESRARAAEDGLLAEDINGVATVANGKNKVFVQSATPTATATGDLWYDTTDSAKVLLKRWSGSAWTVQRVDTKTYSQTAAPTTDLLPGDLWIDTDDQNQLYRWNGSSWVSVRDGYIASHVSASITSFESAKIGYCTKAGVTTEHGTKATCEAAGGTWNGGLPWATAVKSVSASYSGQAVTLQQQFDAVYGTNGLRAQYTVKVDDGSRVAGFGLASEPNLAGGSTFDFTVLADNFAVGAPNRTDMVPFIVKTSSWTDGNGVSQPAGVYISGATIDQLTASKITAGTINADRISAVDLKGNRLLAGNIEVLGGDIYSTGFTAGSVGWKIDNNGSAEFNNVTVRSPTSGSGNIYGGGASAWATGTGLFAGWDSTTYKWRVGNPTGARVQWDGSNFSIYNANSALVLASGGSTANNLIPNSSFSGLPLVFENKPFTGYAPWRATTGADGAMTTATRLEKNTSWIARPPDVSALFINKYGADADTLMYVTHYGQFIPVTGGVPYEMSGYAAGLHSEKNLFVAWYSGTQASPTYISITTEAFARVDFSTDLNSWSYKHKFVTAPANATLALVGVTVGSRVSGTGDNYAIIARLYFGQAKSGQTDKTAWSESIPGKITSSSASTYIANAAISALQVGSFNLIAAGSFSTSKTWTLPIVVQDNDTDRNPQTTSAALIPFLDTGVAVALYFKAACSFNEANGNPGARMKFTLLNGTTALMVKRVRIDSDSDFQSRIATEKTVDVEFSYFDTAPVKDNSYTVKVELVGTRVLQTGNTMTINSAVLTAIGFPR